MIFFVSSDGRRYWASLDGGGPSSCILSDIDGDGIMETLVQNDRGAYLFTGFGTLVTGWPKNFPPSPVMEGNGSRPRHPIAFDVNGDGRVEPIFDINGDLYTFDYNGRLLSGWPRSGESGLYSYCAVLSAGDDRYFLFTSGCVPEIDRLHEESVSFLRRIELGGGELNESSWRFFRRDGRGTSRQEASGGSVVRGMHIDEGSLICYPNPLRGDILNVRLSIYSPASLSIRILNLEGEEVYGTFAKHNWPENSNVPFETSLPLKNLSSGVYICLVEVEGGGWSWRGAKKFAVVR